MVLNMIKFSLEDKINASNVKNTLITNIKNYLANIDENNKKLLIDSISQIKNNYFNFNYFNLDVINEIENYLSDSNNEKIKLFLLTVTSKVIFDLNFNKKEWGSLYNLIYRTLDISRGNKNDDRLYFSINSIKKKTIINFLNNNKYLLILYLIILITDIADID